MISPTFWINGLTPLVGNHGAANQAAEGDRAPAVQGSNVCFDLRPQINGGHRAEIDGSSPLSSRLWLGPDVLQLSRAFAVDVARAWEANGRALDTWESFKVYNALVTALGVLKAREGGGSLACVKNLWEAISYATNQTAYPFVSSPIESAVGHLNGLMLLREKWGDGVAECWREGDFFERAGEAGIPLSAIRRPLDDEFHILMSPGSHETVAGIDYRLVWEGRDVTGAKKEATLATVGFIRRRDGFGITLVQGGPRLTEIKITKNGRPSDLLRFVQSRFAGDPRSWLLDEVIRCLRTEHAPARIDWLRAERRAPLYSHTLHPASPPYGNRTLFAQAGQLPLTDLLALVWESMNRSSHRVRELEQKRSAGTLDGAEAGELEKNHWSLRESVRFPALALKLNAMAAAAGFQPQGDDDTWWPLDAVR